MTKVDRAGAKTTPSRLVYSLSPLKPVVRRPGRLKGRIRIAPDFEAPLPPALVRAFRGRVD